MFRNIPFIKYFTSLLFNVHIVNTQTRLVEPVENNRTRRCPWSFRSILSTDENLEQRSFNRRTEYFFIFYLSENEQTSEEKMGVPWSDMLETRSLPQMLIPYAYRYNWDALETCNKICTDMTEALKNVLLFDFTHLRVGHDKKKRWKNLWKQIWNVETIEKERKNHNRIRGKCSECQSLWPKGQ